MAILQRQIHRFTIKHLLYIVALGVLVTSGAFAQNFPVAVDTTGPSWTRLGLGAQVGYFKSTGADQGAFYFGAEARYMIGSMLGLEGTLGYRSGQTFNFGRVSGANLSADVSSVPITVSLMLFVPLRNVSFVPYLLAGGGLYILSIDYSADINAVVGDETRTKAGTHIGVGANFALTQSIAAHVDYRYLFLNEVFGSNPAYDFSSKDYNGNALTVGFNIFF